MSVLIKDMEIPKSCSECKLDLRTDICKAFCEWNAEHPYSIRATDRLPDCPLSVVPELCEDTVPRASVEYICQKNTVSTNPYKHEYHEKFIKFMDDPEIADFGRWEHSNGFNTALVAVKCDLDKVPSVTPKQPEPHWIPVTERLPYAEYGESNNVLATCGYRDVEDGSIRWIKTLYFNGGNWCYPTGETYLQKVYAWMPLPEPYKGVTE